VCYEYLETDVHILKEAFNPHPQKRYTRPTKFPIDLLTLKAKGKGKNKREEKRKKNPTNVGSPQK